MPRFCSPHCKPSGRTSYFAVISQQGHPNLQLWILHPSALCHVEACILVRPAMSKLQSEMLLLLRRAVGQARGRAGSSAGVGVSRCRDRARRGQLGPEHDHPCLVNRHFLILGCIWARSAHAPRSRSPCMRPSMTCYTQSSIKPWAAAGLKPVGSCVVMIYACRCSAIAGHKQACHADSCSSTDAQAPA